MPPSLTETVGSAPSRRWAVLVSYVLNPLILPPLVLGLAAVHAGVPATTGGVIVAVAMIGYVVVPFGYVVGLVRRGAVRSLEVPTRARRVRPFLVSIGCQAAVVGLVAWLSLADAVLPTAVAAVYLVEAVLLLGITLRWKISLHLAGLASCLALLASFSMLPGRPLLPGGPEALVFVGAVLLPLLGWARVRTGAHTPAQVVAGTGFGLAIAPLLLYAGVMLLGAR